MSKANFEFKLTDISSSYDPENDYFTLQADMKPSPFGDQFILSTKILSYNEDILINTSNKEIMLFENEDDIFGIYDGISGNGNINPNKFDVSYKIFNLVQKNILNLKLTGPPELSRKGGSFIVHQPERSFIGSNKWKFGSISVESIVIRRLEDSFEMFFNLENEDFLTTIPIVEVSGKNWSKKTEPTISETSKFQITLNIYEDTDSSDFDLRFMFFEVGEAAKLLDQVVPEPEIEQSNDDNEEYIEDVAEIVIGNTYDVSAYNRNSLTEITQFENKKSKKMLNVETIWKNGNFKITIQNEEERQELQDCIGDDGDIFDFENYNEIELDEYFDDKGSEFIYWNSCGIDEKEQEQLEDEYQNSSSHIRQDFLEEKGFESLFTNYQIHGGVFVNQIGESESDQTKDIENEVNKSEVSDNVDWEDVGKRAFNQYFNWYRKSENHQECQELADTEISGSFWETELDKESLVVVIQNFGEKMRDIHEEVGYSVDGELLWPMHTWLSDKLYEAQMYHDDEFEDLSTFINEDLPKVLPNDEKEKDIGTVTDTDAKIETINEENVDISENNFFKHNVLLVSIGKSLTENKKIYEAARYAWDAKKERAEKMDYVIAHQSGKIVGVFEAEKWLYADDKEFSNFPESDPKRIGFIGKVADSEILLEYLNKDIPSVFRPKGASNPVRYIELEKTPKKKMKY